MNESNRETQKLKFRVVGTVQGVGYRVWLEGEAKRRGIGGWVRNESDGSVSALLTGDEERLSALAGLLRLGPEAAEVIDAIPLQLDPEDEGWEESGFVIRQGEH